MLRASQKTGDILPTQSHHLFVTGFLMHIFFYLLYDFMGGVMRFRDFIHPDKHQTVGDSQQHWANKQANQTKGN